MSFFVSDVQTSSVAQDDDHKNSMTMYPCSSSPAVVWCLRGRAEITLLDRPFLDVFLEVLIEESAIEFLCLFHARMFSPLAFDVQVTHTTLQSTNAHLPEVHSNPTWFSVTQYLEPYTCFYKTVNIMVCMPGFEGGIHAFECDRIFFIFVAASTHVEHLDGECQRRVGFEYCVSGHRAADPIFVRDCKHGTSSSRKNDKWSF